MPQPWFKLYPADYLLDARVDALTLEAQGILVRLWCLCARDGAIPNDHKTLARRGGIPVKTLGKYWDDLVVFFRIQDGLLVSDRMMLEAQRYGEIVEKRRTSGSAGGRKRVANAKANALAKINQSESETETEGESKDSPNDYCGATAKAATPPDDSPVALLLPCVGRGAKEWPVTERTLAAWKEAFPGVDPMNEARRMKLWLDGNPGRRKTHAGMARFALNWLGRAQDSGRSLTPITTGAPNGKPHHRTATDAAGIRQLEERDARRAAQPQHIITDQEEQDLRAMLQG